MTFDMGEKSPGDLVRELHSPEWGLAARQSRDSRPQIPANYDLPVVVQFESSHLTIAMDAWKPASLKAMPPQSSIM